MSDEAIFHVRTSVYYKIIAPPVHRRGRLPRRYAPRNDKKPAGDKNASAGIVFSIPFEFYWPAQYEFANQVLAKPYKSFPNEVLFFR